MKGLLKALDLDKGRPKKKKKKKGIRVFVCDLLLMLICVSVVSK